MGFNEWFKTQLSLQPLLCPAQVCHSVDTELLNRKEAFPSVTGIRNVSVDSECKVCDDSHGLDVPVFTFCSLSSLGPVCVSPAEEIDRCSL